MQRDIITGLIAGFLIGLFAIPVLETNGLIAKIPSPYISLLVVLPVAAAFGVWVARFVGRWTPFVWQLAKFGLIGVLNTAVDLGIYNTLIYLTGVTQGKGVAAFAIVGSAFAVINSYFWNRRWVFEAGREQSLREFIQFIVVSVTAAVIAAVLVWVTTTYIRPLEGLNREQWANVAKGTAIIFSFIWNFAGFKFFVFRKEA